MKTNFLALLAAVALLPLLSGCVNTVDGHSKAGVPFRKDRIQSRYERPVNQIFESAKTVLNDFGKLEAENRINHSLVAKVDTRTVVIRVDEVDPSVSQVTVQVRTKSGGTDIDLASEIDKQIALRLVAQ
jgi:hypothetical protein